MGSISTKDCRTVDEFRETLVRVRASGQKIKTLDSGEFLKMLGRLDDTRVTYGGRNGIPEITSTETGAIIHINHQGRGKSELAYPAMMNILDTLLRPPAGRPMAQAAAARA